MPGGGVAGGAGGVRGLQRGRARALPARARAQPRARAAPALPRHTRQVQEQQVSTRLVLMFTYISEMRYALQLCRTRSPLAGADTHVIFLIPY